MELDDFGKQLNEVDIKRGLQELNADIHFDMGTNFNQWHPYQSTRQGVFYKGTHVCSMDRGLIPEYKVWDVQEAPVEASFSEADREDVHVAYRVIEREHPGYADLYLMAQRKTTDMLQIREEDGALMYVKCMKMGKTRGRCMRVGWRHVFENLVLRNIPGITRQSLGEKFHVDMYRYPVGTPDVVRAQLMEE